MRTPNPKAWPFFWPQICFAGRRDTGQAFGKSMASYVCSKCASRSPAAGRCIVCLSNLGSLSRGVKSAAVATLAMMVVWLLVTVLLRIQLPIVALVFGGAVAGCTSHFSGGRHGFRIQAIVSGFTLLGIITADSCSMICVALLDDPGLHLSDISRWDVWNDLVFRAVHDPSTALFYSLGFLGSLFIWRK